VQSRYYAKSGIFPFYTLVAKESFGMNNDDEKKQEPRLSALGFCGADDSVHPHHLAVIAHAFPVVEFGVLFRPDREGTPRYASRAWIEVLGATARRMRDAGTPMKMAAHLCGSRVNKLLNGGAGATDLLEDVHNLGFTRVQINATAVNGVDTSQLHEAAPNIWQVLQQFPQIEFIVQKNEETRPLWEPLEAMQSTAAHALPNLAMLVDESKGTGILSSSWPVPSPLYKTGYAGGIGPHNVTSVLTDITQAVAQGPNDRRTFWIDMESSLRSIKNERDIFDLDKCFQVIDAVCSMQLMDRPSYLPSS
jgi:hypothetical protein